MYIIVRSQVMYIIVWSSVMYIIEEVTHIPKKW